MKKYFPIITVLISTVVVLVICEGALRLINLNHTIKYKLVDQPGRKVGMFDYDEDLGWRNRPNFKKNFEWSYRTTLEQINSDGLRDREFSIKKDKDVFRIAVFGCSRTYGYGVNAEETYSKQLEQLLNKKYSQKFEVMNFGVNGYGLSQMTLNYLKNGRKYNPDLVILQFYSPTVFRVARTRLNGTQKPTFIIKDDQLMLINSPVPRDRFRPIERWLIDKSHLYKLIKDKLLKVEEILMVRFHSKVAHNEELNALCSRILAFLDENVKKDNSRLIVFTWGGGGIYWRKPILENAGVEHFILEEYGDLESWKKKGDTQNPPPTLHFSPIGNGFVAESIMEYLETNVLNQGSS